MAALYLLLKFSWFSRIKIENTSFILTKHNPRKKGNVCMYVLCVKYIYIYIWCGRLCVICHGPPKHTHTVYHQSVHSHPTSITHIVNAFSASVFGATFPNPTEVNELNVKYSAVMYLDWKERKKSYIRTVIYRIDFQRCSKRKKFDWKVQYPFFTLFYSEFWAIWFF